MAVQSLEQQIKKLLSNKKAISQLKTRDGKTAAGISEDILKAEALRLRDCVKNRIKQFYDTYPPSESYVRTERLLHSLDNNRFQVKQDSQGMYIDVTFDKSLSYGDSLIGGTPGYKPWLIDQGWKTNILFPSFRGFIGFNFMEKGIADWKKGLKHSIRLELNHYGNMGFADVLGWDF